MRKIIFFLTGLIAMTASLHSAFAAAPQTTAAGRPDPAESAAGETIVRKLPNGLTVLVRKDDRFPLVSLRLYVHAGSAYEQPDQAGISHLLEHMVFKGTDKRPKSAVATDVEKTGGYLNAATSFDYTVYLTDMTKDHWKTGLDVLKDMAFHASLNPAELEAEKDVVIAELKRGEDNPGQRLFRMIQQEAFKGTPYADPIIGYEKTVRAISRDDMRAYIERLYQPQSMLLVICGNVKPDEALAEAQAQFGDLENTRPVTPPASLESALAPKGFAAVVESGPWQKVHLALALPAPGRGDVRAAQYDVLAQLLGGDATSRFYRTYKYEKRLVDSISVGNYDLERLGAFYIQVTLDADKLPAFWEAFSKDLAGLASATFTQDELNRAKLNIEDDLFRSKETLAGYASKLGAFAFSGAGERGESNYLSVVRDTDQRVLTELLKTTFRPDALSLAVLLPEGARPPQAGKAPAPEKTAEKSADKQAAEKGEQANAASSASPSSADQWKAWLTNVLAAKWKSPEAGKTQAAQAGKAGGPEVIDLGQGRTLILTPDTTLPYVAVTMTFSGGDSLLTEKDQGLAAFTASLLSKGTKKLSATAMEDYLADRAASFSATAGRQGFSVNMNFPARFTADMFDLLQSSLVTPAMKDDEASRVSENQVAAITAREDQPTGLAFRRMFPFLFGNHPYGFLQLGEKDRVAAFTAKDAKEFWREQTLRPWALSVCGSYDKDAILAAVKKLPVPAKKEKTVDDPAWGKTKELDLKLAGRQQAHLLMVFPAVGYGNPDEAGLDLLQNILAGQSGLLFRDLRDKQSLGYTVTAFPWKSAKAGALVFYIGTEPGKLAQAEAGFRSIIKELQSEPLPAEELERGKNQIRGDYYREHQSLASRSSEAAALTVLGLPLDYARNMVDKTRAVDAKTLQQLARKYLQPDKAYMVVVKP